jgi:hypothetical protein
VTSDTAPVDGVVPHRANIRVLCNHDIVEDCSSFKMVLANIACASKHKPHLLPLLGERDELAPQR